MKLNYSRKVHFYETDAQGVVHHSNYPRYFEEARGYFLEKIGYPYHKVREELNIDVVLVELSVKYKNPLKYGDIFNIEFWISHMDRFFFDFDYVITVNKTQIATGKTKHACIDRFSRKLVSVPEVLRKGYGER
ncbi:thioesterase family protein [Persephonella sp. IF05-L8]|uniref:YbgC/FadM family acyl-CoA thioesterase n=1 Tax=Persephonella sp. IF05-L8 TaxID=1158338 RepID=UPI0004954E82